MADTKNRSLFSFGYRSPARRWIRRNVRRRWYWLMARVWWRWWGPGVTSGPIRWWWFRHRRGFPCADQVIYEAFRARRRDA